MKRPVRILICILFASLLFFCGGCQPVDRILKSVLAETQAPPAPSASADDYKSRVEFFNAEGTPQYIQKQELLLYKSEYADCMGNWFRDRLSGDSLLIYQALLYAMEHCYTNVGIFVEDTSMDLYRPRDFLAMDSPFLEQNYSSEEEIVILGSRVTYRMDRFCQQAWELKMQALGRAREIAQSVPASCVSELQRMAYVYDFLREFVVYTSYQDGQQANYLYDALCRGKTNCDGYSNALALLLRLTGISCCEAMGDDGTEEEGELVGHTWVCGQLEGRFYNFDATFDEAADDNDFAAYRRYFGVSDNVLSMTHFEYDEERPVCDEVSRDMDCADGYFEDMTSYDCIAAAAALSDQRTEEGKLRTLLSFPGGFSEKDVEHFMDVFIEQVENSASVSYIPCFDGGRTLLLLITEE